LGDEAKSMANVKRVVYKGVEYGSIRGLADQMGINITTFRYRLRKGMSVEEAVETPVVGREPKRNVFKGVEYASIAEMCRAHEVSVCTFNSRIRLGYSLEDALKKTPRRGMDGLDW